jgi:DNA-binding IclR family transcriptional regulator
VNDKDDEKYRAPALEKGLDILELISKASTPLTIANITQALGRSTGELHRMFQVLERRGFISQSETGGGYVATSKLFSLGMEQAPVRSILEVALPVMARLAENSGQSCHLALRIGGDIVIAARAEAAGLIGFSVRIGYRQPLPMTGSGVVLYAFQGEETRRQWENVFSTAPVGGLDRFRAEADEARARGYAVHPSTTVPGIIDLSAPVLRGEVAAAALTVPFVNKFDLPVQQDAVLELLRSSAREISAQLVEFDVRV